jgi:hypothetical protein
MKCSIKISSKLSQVNTNTSEIIYQAIILRLLLKTGPAQKNLAYLVVMGWLPPLICTKEKPKRYSDNKLPCIDRRMINSSLEVTFLKFAADVTLLLISFHNDCI